MSVTSHRKLASGHLLSIPDPTHEMKEKRFFRHQTEILSRILQSDIRYCPSYKRSSFGYNTNLRNAAHGNGVISGTPLTPMSRTSESNRRSKHTKDVSSPAFSKHSSISNRRGGRSRNTDRSTSSSISRHDERRPSARKISRDHASDQWVHSDSYSISKSFQGHNLGRIQSRSNTHTATEVKESKVSGISGCPKIGYTDKGRVKLLEDSTDSNQSGDEDDEGTSSSGTSSEVSARVLFSRRHGPSIQCDVLGPLACKFCTRHLSIVNSSALNLSRPDSKVFSEIHDACPLCLAEQGDLDLPSRRTQTRSAPTRRHWAKSQFYTPLEIFLRIRNRKRLESCNDVIDCEGQDHSGSGGLFQACEQGGRKHDEGDDKAMAIRGHQGRHEDNCLSEIKHPSGICSPDGLHTESGNTLNRSMEDNENSFDGMKITVRYLKYNDME